jgi:hypothetical protein
MFGGRYCTPDPDCETETRIGPDSAYRKELAREEKWTASEEEKKNLKARKGYSREAILEGIYGLKCTEIVKNLFTH